MTHDLEEIEVERAREARARLAPQPGDAFDFNGPPPAFYPCESTVDGRLCGKLGTMRRCYECAQYETEQRERVAAQAESRRLLEASIPIEFADADASKPHILAERVRLRENSAGVAPTIAEMLQRIVQHPHTLTFWGPARQGKTTLAVAALRLRGSGLFVSARRLTLARAQHKRGDGEAPLVTRCMHASLLLVDDLGEEEKAFDCPIVDVLKTRFSAGRPTWVTTGLTGAEVTQKYSAGVKARLTDLPRAWIVPFGARPARHQ